MERNEKIATSQATRFQIRAHNWLFGRTNSFLHLPSGCVYIVTVVVIYTIIYYYIIIVIGAYFVRSLAK